MSTTSSPDKSRLQAVLVTDCGSTTTKAVLFEKTAAGWRQTFRGEAPTTVEKPVADVTIGARNAFQEVQELSGRKVLLDDSGDGAPPFAFRTDADPANGIDLYLSTSSAGGGLQMIVAGVVSNMTTRSAERAALGAGAIVMDAISFDDGRQPYERVQRIRHLRPDIVLLSGGTDGGTVTHPVELAETVLQADPRPRFGDTLKLPIIYAANEKARAEVEDLLAKRFSFVAVENVRPTLENENLAPARDAIHELFLNHVMSHAPGYKKLLGWSPVPILPTPGAFGDMVLVAAKQRNQQILAVDIGGATTDVFSVIFTEEAENGVQFHRTVSANLGMSYSVANVLLEAGEANIERWLPFPLSWTELRDRLRNKMIRPTSIPHTIEDLLLEQAVSREALRLAFLHHKRLAVGLKGKKRKRTIGDVFKQGSAGDEFDLMAIDLIIGSGGVLSHAPDRKSAALMLVDAFQPQGVTALAVDSIFMMPHLGVFSSVHPEAATEILERDCLVSLGTVVAPTGTGKHGQDLLEVEFPDGSKTTVRCGELVRRELADGEQISLKLTPLRSWANVGAGPGKSRTVLVSGGHAGLIIDGRGRPLEFSANEVERQRRARDWHTAFDLLISSDPPVRTKGEQ